MGTILIFGAVMAIGIAITVAISAYSVNTVRVGGNVYNKIVQTKDLVADILPPPLYVIEAYLEANLAFNQSKPLLESKAKILKLRGEYDERWKYWKASDLAPKLKAALTEDSHASASAFWAVIVDKLLPAIDKNRSSPEAADAFGEMNKYYAAHRKIIDGIVIEATALGETIEAGSAQDTKIALWSIVGVDAALFILLIVGIAMIAKRLVNPLSALGAGLARLSEGNLTQKMTQKVPPEYRQLQDNYNIAIDRLQEIMGSVKSSAREVTNASAEISTSTTDLSQRTEEQAASLEETSASMEEISSTVKNNAENARKASDSAANTQKVADRGGQVVAEAVQAMAKIEDSSRKISDIIGVIDEIARQTNLLALNAAVEAARAGEAGRGFAVVASEVRSLAQRSSQAAKDIKDLITNSNGQVKDGVELVNRAGESLTEIVASIKSVASIVSDIANASIEQSTGIEQINKALTQMDEVTQQNSALVEENAATAKTLEHQAKSMGEQVEFFQIAVGDDSQNFSREAQSRHGHEETEHRHAATGHKSSSAVRRVKSQAVGVPVRQTSYSDAQPLSADLREKLDTAIEKHAEWKVKLRAAITSQEPLDTPTIAKDNCCQLGQWLYGDGRAKFGAKHEFQSLVALHKAFHSEAANVSRLIDERKYAQADKALSSDTVYTKASSSVASAIMALKRAVGA